MARTIPRQPNAARQAHDPAYFRGNIIATRAPVLKNRSLYGERSGAHIIPYLHGIDIDSEIDFLLLES